MISAIPHCPVFLVLISIFDLACFHNKTSISLSHHPLIYQFLLDSRIQINVTLNSRCHRSLNHCISHVRCQSHFITLRYQSHFITFTFHNNGPSGPPSDSSNSLSMASLPQVTCSHHKVLLTDPKTLF